MVITYGAGCSEALAQNVCGIRADIVAQLALLYGEQPTAVGLDRKKGNLVEILSSREGTWTLIFTRPRGQACVIEHGQAWQAIPAKAGTPPLYN